MELFTSENYTIFSYGHELYWKNLNCQRNIENIKHRKIEEHSGIIHKCYSLEECISKTYNVISGIPLSKDGVTVFAPFCGDVIRLDELKNKLTNKTFIAGAIPEWFNKNIEKNTEIIDLNFLESFTVLNAIPTVEGVIKIAIEETDITIHESYVLILGYGRIGKILCHRFKAFGAKVYCAVRKSEDFVWLREEGCIPINYKDITKYCGNIDIVVNTVPVILINEDILKKLKENCIIIDVASKPGGVDKEVLKMYKVRVITALGLPGKVAPKTSAQYIKQAIEEKIREI